MPIDFPLLNASLNGLATLLLIVGFVILLLFGHRLPGMMRSLGRGFVEFKHGLKGDDKDPEEIAQSNDEEPSSSSEG